MVQSKGLDTLREVAALLAEEGLEEHISIDFYGQKKDDYFDNNLTGIGNFRYKGVLQPNEVVDTLKKYDALIFPTYYPGEGCPGILVETLIASLPVIASDWKYNDEFVGNGDNGFLCETRNASAYVEAIKTLLANKTLCARMAARSHDRSEYFSAEKVRDLIKNLE